MPCHLGTGFGKASLGSQPADRFRREQPNQNADDQRDEAQQGDAAPAVGSHDRRRDRRGEEPAGRRKDDIKAGRNRAVAGRREFDDHRQRWRHRRGQADTDEEPQNGEQEPRAFGDECDQPRAHRADEGADHHLLLATPGVGKGAEHHRAQDCAHTTTVQDHRGLAVGQVPLPRDRRQQIADHEEIEEIEDKDCRHQDEDGPVTAIERRIVEQRQKVAGRLIRLHCSSR